MKRVGFLANKLCYIRANSNNNHLRRKSWSSDDDIGYVSPPPCWLADDISSSRQGVIIPAQPKPFLLIDKHVKINVSQLKDKATITNSLVLGNLLEGNKQYALSSEAVLTFFDGRNIALQGKSNHQAYSVALYRRIQEDMIMAYYWPYLLPIAIRPNLRAGWGAVNNRPAKQPVTLEDIEAQALLMERARKNVQIAHKAPSPKMPEGYRAQAPQQSTVQASPAINKELYEYAAATLVEPGAPYRKEGSSTLATMKYGDGLIPGDLYSIFPTQSLQESINDRLERYQKRKQLISTYSRCPGGRRGCQALSIQ